MKRLITIFVYIAAMGVSSEAATTLPAFPFTYYIHDTTGAAPDVPLGSIYQFAATPLGSNSNVVIRAVNTSQAPAFMGSVSVTANASSTSLNTNFTITGLANQLTVAAGGSLVFTINFSPTITGTITGYLQTVYQVQQSGCTFTSTNPATQCPGGLGTC